MSSYFHVRISVEGERHDEAKTDLDNRTLDRQVLEPYRTGHPITINGKVLPLENVTRIRISQSEEPSSQIIQRLKLKDEASQVAVLGGPTYKWRAAAAAQDVTDDYITGPPGAAESTVASPMASVNAGRPGDAETGRRSVFVIAGRDDRAIAAVVALLRALGLRVIEWEQAVAKTGVPNPYVGDVVETGLRMADAAVVLLTPDDVVRLRADLLRDDDGPDEREPGGQARPNAYYEAGFADAIGRDRTVIIEVGKVRPFSDVSGRHVVKYDGSPGKRNALAERLRVAGLDVETSGDDWLVVGAVDDALASASLAFNQTMTAASSSTVDRSALIDQVDELLAYLTSARERSAHDDISDLPDESLDFVFRAQALVDRVAPDSSYGREAEGVRDAQPHMRIPILAAALRAIRSELAST